MQELTVTFSKEFDFFLRKKKHGFVVTYPLERKASIKDILESLGIPHTEIGKILIAGREISFNFIPQESMVAEIHPIIPPFDVTKSSILRPEPLNEYRFIVDVNVGKLAAFLRIMGVDAKYSPDFSDHDISTFADKEKRIVLSKDLELFKRKQIVYGRYVRSLFTHQQLSEILFFYNINRPYQFFSRCLQCNKKLVKVDKQSILHHLEPKTKKYFFRFKICSYCDKIYWQGSHYEKMLERLKESGVDIPER